MRLLRSLLAVCAIVAASTVAAQASTSYTYQVAGQASATITLDTNRITITLTDLYVNPTSVAQNLSAFWFTTSVDPSSVSISSSSAAAITVASNGSVTSAGTIAPGWALTEVSAVTRLDDLAAGASGPSDTIIGAPGPGGVYSNGNGSITGNGPHNPFLSQSASWTLSEIGVNAATTISNVYFMFGTAENAGVAGSRVSATPEPSTFTMVFGALAIFLGARRAKRQPSLS